MAGHVSVQDTVGAASLLGWALAMWIAIAALALANRRRRVGSRTCKATVLLIAIGLVGQVGHLQEHVAQVGYWVRHPDSPGWMTPWGMGLARGLGQVDRTKPALGMEILHLTGNLIFLAGLVAVMLVTHRARATKTRRWARMGTWMQTIHGLEHLSLTLSVAFGAQRAIGLSTWFGTMPPGPGLWTYRVWWHFVANVLGSAVFAITAWHLWHERRVIEASYQEGSPTTPASSGSALPAGAAGEAFPITSPA